MNTLFQLNRAFIFLLLASFSSTALSVTVGSESGGASLDGAWAFPGCSLDPGEFDDRDYQEFVIFSGGNFEDRIYQYASSDESCSGEITNVLTDIIVDISVVGNVESPGWGEDGSATPPACQDPAAADCQDNEFPGLLDSSPVVTEVAFFLGGDELGTDLFYIDDTGLTWYLYRAGGVETPSEFIFPDEPLIKSELPIGVIPVPAGIWLFATALIGFVGFSRRRIVG